MGSSGKKSKKRDKKRRRSKSRSRTTTEDDRDSETTTTTKIEREEEDVNDNDEADDNNDTVTRSTTTAMETVAEGDDTDSTGGDGAATASSSADEKKEEEKELNDDNKDADENATDDENAKPPKQSDDPSTEQNQTSSSSDSTSVLTTQTFASLGVCPPLCTATASLHWPHATTIQSRCLPPALRGHDIVGLAETGSGKTGAFTIPILQSLLHNPQRNAVYALILAPTRELAFQIHDVVAALGAGIGAECVCIVGGVDSAQQSIALARNPHVVVATPGRLLDHLTNTKGFHLRRLRYLVMDEADRMLSMDFEKELDQILDAVPPSASTPTSPGRRTMLFSATMTSKVQKLQRASLVSPVRIEVSTKFQTPAKLLQSYLFIPAKYKDIYLTYLVNDHAGQSILVFGATCNNVQRLALMLRNLGFPAVCLHGQMTQPKRLGALTRFKSGARTILVCTDVASRGLDIPSVDLVINYDLPGHGKDYIHRVGRTARAGKSGKAIAIVTQYDVEVYQRLEGLLGRKLPECRLDEETVLILGERVDEAQRMATRELKEQLASAKGDGRGGGGMRKRRGMGGGGGDGEGEEDGVEGVVRRELRKGYSGGSGGRGGALHNQRGSGRRTKKTRR